MTKDYREWSRLLFNGNHFSSILVKFVSILLEKFEGLNLCPKDFGLSSYVTATWSKNILAQSLRELTSV